RARTRTAAGHGPDCKVESSAIPSLHSPLHRLLARVLIAALLLTSIVPVASASSDRGRIRREAFRQATVARDQVYNEARIKPARASGCVYREFKDEIESARAKYSARVGGGPVEASYWAEAVVDVLCGGDAAALASSDELPESLTTGREPP